MVTPNTKRIKNNLAYFLNVGENNKERVCKKIFKVTLFVSNKIIRNSFNGLNSEEILKTLQQSKYNKQKNPFTLLKCSNWKKVH